MSKDGWRDPAELPLDWLPLRRAAERVGRNDPCPCGSGKKYKRCCEAKHQDREASPFAGMTMDEALADPGRHGDPRIIEKIPEDQLGGLELARLAVPQLASLVRRAYDLARWELAEAALAEFGRRAEEPDFHFDEVRAELVHALVEAKEYDRLAAQLAAVEDAADPLYAAAGLVLAKGRAQPEALERLEQLLRVELDHGQCMMEVAEILRVGGLPALALALFRACAFEQLSDADLDLLAEDTEAVRADLGLAAHDPVVEAHLELLERLDAERGAPDLIEQKARQNAALLAELRAAREQLRELEVERSAARTASGPDAQHHGALDDPGGEQVVSLKRKLARLKSEIRAQQDERRELRRRLREEREERPAAPPGPDREAPGAEEPDDSAALPDERSLKPVEFGDAFRRSLTGIEPKLALKAQEQAVRFAAYDPAMWRHAKKLADFEDLYSLRVGIHHRLLLRRTAEGGVEVRELLTREQHDVAVARYRR
ncbi:MAG: SEC-C metal-binding domain-containing protein [Sorangiineae bacterium]|nr:SEC-C metal-binding domain-containing protein [Polyangiaceae bacterium]MEB2324576.1 SEC-C metal-binding domain-containing protein [Sorangiineae bacterium]